MDLNLFAGLIAVHDDRMKQTNCRNADHQPLDGAFIERELPRADLDDVNRQIAGHHPIVRRKDAHGDT
jgi:hypothetical protein